MPTDHLTPDVLATAILDVAACVEALVRDRGQVAHRELELRQRLSKVARALRPPPATVAPAAAAAQ